MNTRKLLVTSALPYANGSLHLGHLVEYIQTDIWVRHQKMFGHECYYICADDTHGTPIMLKAEAEGITPEALIERVHAERIADFARFHIGFDNYHSTHSEENRVLSAAIYEKLNARGFIATYPVEQLYDPVKNIFLSDRYIKGECPSCHAQDQYGDACEVCGTAYTPMELIAPYSAISGAIPVKKQSLHYFFKLGACADFLSEWTQAGHLQAEAANKMSEWFKTGLRDWDISRDAPYFGFEIPGAPGKFFYVWLDAPIGYMASFLNLSQRRPEINFDAYWAEDSTAELYHFIGKDILYFHALFWPGMLKSASYRTPTKIFAHGMLTVNGEKMSKSRGTFITAANFLKHLNPEHLRYYYATKLNASLEDIDLNLDDFLARVNSDLVGKYINIASRSAAFIHKMFAGRLIHSANKQDALIQERLAAAAPQIQGLYEAREYAKAMREIMRLADLANQYVDESKPWELAKNPVQRARLHEVCSTSLNLFRLLSIYLKPVLPATVQNVEAFLQIPALGWQSIQDFPQNPILSYRHLMTRVDPKQTAAVLEDSLEDLKKQESVRGTTINSPVAEAISIEEFAKLDLRVAKIIQAEEVPGADKLLKLTLDIGTDSRVVFAGIKAGYKPEALIGRMTVLLANLASKKMRFGISHGMVLAAGDGQDIYLLSPDTGAQPGMRIK